MTGRDLVESLRHAVDGRWGPDKGSDGHEFAQETLRQVAASGHMGHDGVPIRATSDG